MLAPKTSAAFLSIDPRPVRSGICPAVSLAFPRVCGLFGSWNPRPHKARPSQSGHVTQMSSTL